ncbi:MAG: 5-(carboxyamino)imidazole ribonucleotide mutase [Deltaproteobacteria bacterium]|nr:5-(carboxyamino)imidazole ribonucleotide mutase [Deltaproteobacteria bacterium]
MTQPLVAIVMGSDSDLPVVKETISILKAFEVPCEVRVISAHRTPDLATDFAGKAAGRGIQVIIAAAGGAAHLAGVLAAGTLLPVIGVPIPSSSLQGLDALLSTVQMPGGVPVATMGIGNGGAKNAGLLAIRILALENGDLREALKEYRATQHKKVEEADQRVRDLG